jgi:hypothetical protein
MPKYEGNGHNLDEKLILAINFNKRIYVGCCVWNVPEEGIKSEILLT